MGRDYNVTVREAAEMVRDIGIDALEDKWEGSQYWRGLYFEAIIMLHSALKTKGLPEPPSYCRRTQGRRHPVDWEQKMRRRHGMGRRREDCYKDRKFFDDYDPQRPSD